MSLDREVFAERVAAVERHLARVAHKLPATAAELTPSSDTSDAVILHLWQATQIVLDIAIGTCARLKLGTPAGYADAFTRLGAANIIEAALARRLSSAAGFRNVIAHAYESLDMVRVHRAATDGPTDLRAFLTGIRDHAAQGASS
jgi:uncharacterized protein YutE (UPF0331/DUF86 family)